MTATSTLAPPAPPPAKRGHHTGAALGVIAGAQLMVVLDATIVNVALPKIESPLGFSDSSLSWVLNAYTLAFGGLLLLGGRLGDILGRRRMFMIGIAIFTLASFIGGFAQNSAWLLTARAVQGVGAAIASPTALALITTNFMEGKERNRAFGVFAAVSGSGAAIGLLAGGMLTDWLSWRWVLFVNAPIGIAVLLLAPLYINQSNRVKGHFDLGGALTSTAGMTALVYGFIHASEDGWSDTWTIAAFVASAALLVLFGVIERLHTQPIVPMKMFANRDRASAYAIMFMLTAGMMGMFYFLTLFVQKVLLYSPLRAGLAFLPISAFIMISAQLSSRLLIRLGSKPFMAAGAILATGGLAWLSQISVHTSYLGILGPMALFGFGMGFLFVPLTITAVSGVQPSETGAASALLNVMQQVGGSVGLSILVTVFSTAQRNKVTDFVKTASPAQQQQAAQGKLPTNIVHEALSHGISQAFLIAVIFAAVALVMTLLGRNTKPPAGEDAIPVAAA
ncbi:MAG TPA: MFS transporter [Mycobacteriales bacterium]|nr:MFS transporter [Mycobacteriales bacterium]